MTSQTKTRKMSHHLLNHMNQQQSNEESIDPILLVLKAIKEAMDVVEKKTTSFRKANMH